MTTNQKLDQILEKVNLLDTKVDSLDAKVDSLDAKVNSLDTKVNSLDTKVDSLDTKVNSLEIKMTSVEEKIDSLDQRTALLESDMKEVKQQIHHTNFIIENELRTNIKRVAEGHIDLSRKLDEYIKLTHEIKDKQELQDIYINMHSGKLAALSGS